MALYYYRAISRDGKSVTGYLDASTVQGAREQLSKMGIYPTQIEAAPDQTGKQFFLTRFFQRGISLKDKIFFTKQLSVLLKSGIPLLQALELLIEQTEGRLQNIVIALKDGIKEGKSLADGLQKYPKVFDTIYIQLVRAGEATGKLEIILDRLTNYLQSEEELRKKVKGALRYPIIQLSVIILVVIGLLYLVVPKITEVFARMGAKLPLPTRILMGISNAVINYFYIFIVLIIALIVGYRFFKATTQGAYLIDKLKLNLPIFGYFTKTSAIVQFSRTLGMLMEGGVNLSQALNIVVAIIDNKVLAKELEQAKENIIKQGKIAQYLKATGIFPPVSIYLINTGEQSGELDTMLTSVAGHLEDELKERAEGLTTLLQPIMLLIMAGVVGFVILSVLMPVQQMQDQAGKMLAR